VLEVEHWSLLAGVRLWQWERALIEHRRAEERVRADECKAAFAYSPGSLDHFRRFLTPEVWPKLDYVLPAFPHQPEVEASRDEAFTILTIGNRFFDKGFPEALRAFEILRARHGPRVRMALVSYTVPHGWRLPEGVAVYDTPRMTPELKAGVYRSADVLLELSYVDSLTCPVEACAFGLPTVATRIHHGESFVREGQSGYLVDPPMYAYSDEYGTRWRNWADFTGELQVMREGGRLDGVVEDVVDRLEPMLSGGVNLDQLRDGARRLHAERFSLEARNAKLNAIYARALAR